MPSVKPALHISAVERETGLSKEVLRKWESRYGFPAPLRDENGERVYPPEQVTRLRLIKRLMDRGMRPSKLVGQSSEKLMAAATPSAVPETEADRSPGAGPGVTATVLALLRAHDLKTLRRRLGRLLQEQGLRTFVRDTTAPVTRAVGEAWARGELEVYEEHLYSEVIQGLLRSAMDPLNDPEGRPRMLLTTVPEEPHSLGLLMVAGVFVLGGAHCISLGPQTPLEDIASGARAHDVDVVVLSFSTAYPQRRIRPTLAELRQRLGPDLEIWAGGGGHPPPRQPGRRHPPHVHPGGGGACPAAMARVAPACLMIGSTNSFTVTPYQRRPRA